MIQYLRILSRFHGQDPTPFRDGYVPFVKGTDTVPEYEPVESWDRPEDDEQ